MLNFSQKNLTSELTVFVFFWYLWLLSHLWLCWILSLLDPVTRQIKATKLDEGQKPLLWFIGSFKYAHLWFLNDASWPGTIAKSQKTFSTIKICNIKSIQQTEVQKTAKNLCFGSLDHSKMHFCDIWMILHDLVMLPNTGTHLVLSQYAISSRSNRINSRKLPRTSFLALWII